MKNAPGSLPGARPRTGNTVDRQPDESLLSDPVTATECRSPRKNLALGIPRPYGPIFSRPVKKLPPRSSLKLREILDHIRVSPGFCTRSIQGRISMLQRLRCTEQATPNGNTEALDQAIAYWKGLLKYVQPLP